VGKPLFRGNITGFREMKRRLEELCRNEFELLVVGGGIHGAAAAREGVRLGLKTALIEKGDFGEATSANSLKIIHGGLRYLQDLDLRRMRESIRSRREMMRTAPHLVSPLGCVIPTRGFGLRSKYALRAALLLNDLISWDRNRGVRPSNRLPAGRILSREESLRIVGGEREYGLTGGALWYDGLALDSERLTLTFVKEAALRGACAANYVKGRRLIVRNGKVYGIEAEDVLSGAVLEIKAPVVLNAAGPWLTSLPGPENLGPLAEVRWVKAINVIVKKNLFEDFAVGLQGPKERAGENGLIKKGKRFYFFVPWLGRTMIGTHYTFFSGSPDTLRVEPRELEEFISDINAARPPTPLAPEDVAFVHVGLLPAPRGKDDLDPESQLYAHAQLIDHGKTGGPAGLVSLRTVKYTTAPVVARRALKLVLKRYFPGRTPAAFPEPRDSQTDTDNQEARPAGRSGNNDLVVRHLKRTYGSQWREVRDYCTEGDGGEWISDDPPLLEGEIVYFIEKEMAQKLSDLVLRRSNLGAVGRPPESVLRKAADIAAPGLGWDENRKRNEVKEVLDRYFPAGSPETLHDEA